MDGKPRRRHLLALAGIAIILKTTEKRKKDRDDDAKASAKRVRPWWVRPWILDKSLTEYNTVYKLQLELEKVS